MKSCIIQSCVVDYPKHFFWLFNVILNVTKDKNQFFILQFSKIVKFDLQPTKIKSMYYIIFNENTSLSYDILSNSLHIT